MRLIISSTLRVTEKQVFLWFIIFYYQQLLLMKNLIRSTVMEIKHARKADKSILFQIVLTMTKWGFNMPTYCLKISQNLMCLYVSHWFEPPLLNFLGDYLKDSNLQSRCLFDEVYSTVHYSSFSFNFWKGFHDQTSSKSN